jgi:hypothetical protein
MASGTFLIFFPIPGGPHGTISNDHRSVYFARIITNSGAGCKSALYFLSHFFSAPRENFCEKNYLKFSLQFLAGNMKLLGRCYLCAKWCDYQVLHQHFREQHRRHLCKCMSDGLQNFSETSLCPGGHMEHLNTHRWSIDIARNVIN